MKNNRMSKKQFEYLGDCDKVGVCKMLGMQKEVSICKQEIYFL